MKCKLILPIGISLFCYFGPKAQESENAVIAEVTETAMEKTPQAQDSFDITIPPLFEYITAPEDLPDLQSRTDYLMEHFWNPFDFKKNTVVDQNALNHAFNVYVEAMAYASEKKALESIKKLIAKIKGNPGLSYQFAKAAEENLYGPRADFWADEVYMSFLQNLVDNKKISESKKKKYIEQLGVLKRSALGAVLPDLQVTNINGTSTALNPNKKFTIISFVSPDCDNCNYVRLLLDINGAINDLMQAGMMDIYWINLQEGIPENNCPESWHVFSCNDAGNILDLRHLPSFYIIDQDKKIVGKNMNVNDAVAKMESLKEASK